MLSKISLRIRKKILRNMRISITSMNNIYFVNKEVDHICSKCEAYFSLRNKLFKHLREKCQKVKSKTLMSNTT